MKKLPALHTEYVRHRSIIVPIYTEVDYADICEIQIVGSIFWQNAGAFSFSLRKKLRRKILVIIIVELYATWD